MLLNISGEIIFFKYKRKLFKCFSYIRSYSVKKNGLKVLFFGTDNFSLPSVKVLHNSSLKNSKVSAISVVTSFKSPANCVKTYTETNSIQAYKWPITENICRQYDLGVVVSFGHMIPESLIKAFPQGMINVHASILPRWRGAAPIIYSIMKGDTKTGVSIMKIEPNKFDIGEIYAQKEVEIGQHTLMPELHQLLAEEGANLLNSTLEAYPECFKNPQKQNDSEATYAPKIVPTVAEVNWKTMVASEIYNLYRALFGYKHLSTKFQDFNVKLVELRLGPTLEKHRSFPGSIENVRSAKCLRVRCKDGTSVDVLRVKVEGKRTMTALEFTNGFLRKFHNVPLVFN